MSRRALPAVAVLSREEPAASAVRLMSAAAGVDEAMSKPRVLLQLDSDGQPSVFDSVVAADCGVGHLLRHGSVTPENVESLVHGAMFTRGPDDLKQTAIFVGGSDVRASEKVLQAVTDCFFGPMRVSVMLDAGGCNTTAAAAVLSLGSHLELKGAEILVLAATGPVGRRILRLLARQGARVRATSRTLAKAKDVCADIATDIPGSELTPYATVSPEGIESALSGAQAVISAGAPGVVLLPSAIREKFSLQAAIDLSAVPPLGIEGIEMTDRAAERDGTICYGAIGVGAAKMKIHRAAIERLFQANDAVLDAEEIFDIGQALSQ